VLRGGGGGGGWGGGGGGGGGGGVGGCCCGGWVLRARGKKKGSTCAKGGRRGRLSFVSPAREGRERGEEGRKRRPKEGATREPKGGRAAVCALRAAREGCSARRVGFLPGGAQTARRVLRFGRTKKGKQNKKTGRATAARGGARLRGGVEKTNSEIRARRIGFFFAKEGGWGCCYCLLRAAGWVAGEKGGAEGVEGGVASDDSLPPAKKFCRKGEASA